MSSQKDQRIVDYQATVRPRKCGWASPSAGLIGIAVVVALMLIVGFVLATILIRHISIGVLL